MLVHMIKPWTAIMATKFLYVSPGILALSAAYDLEASSATESGRKGRSELGRQPTVKIVIKW